MHKDYGPYYELGMGELEGVSAKDVIARLKWVAGTTSRRGLAEWLGVKQTWIKDALNREIIPQNWLFVMVDRESKYNPLWVLTGKGRQLMTPHHFFTRAGVRCYTPETKTPTA